MSSLSGFVVVNAVGVISFQQHQQQHHHHRHCCYSVWQLPCSTWPRRFHRSVCKRDHLSFSLSQVKITICITIHIYIHVSIPTIQSLSLFLSLSTLRCYLQDGLSSLSLSLLSYQNQSIQRGLSIIMIIIIIATYQSGLPRSDSLTSNAMYVKVRHTSLVSATTDESTMHNLPTAVYFLRNQLCTICPQETT